MCYDEEYPQVLCPKCEPAGSIVEIHEQQDLGPPIPTYTCWDCGFSRAKDDPFWDDHRWEGQP